VIIKFDLSTLPSQVQDIYVKKAELSLFNANSGKTRVREDGDSVSVKVCAKPWNESQVTWLTASTGTPWTTPGGDFASGIISTRAFSDNGTWETYDVTPAIKTFLKTPSANHGLIIAGTIDFKGILTTSTPHRQYASSEFTDVPGMGPKLAITYNTSAISYTAPANLLGKNISVHVNAERVKFFVPLKNSYAVTVSDIKGRQIRSFKAAGEAWFQVPAAMLSNGMHIISISTEGTKASTKFLFVK